MSADTTLKMQSIIDKHMLAAFEEMGARWPLRQMR